MAGTTHYRFKVLNQIGELWDIQIKDSTYVGTDFITLYPDGNGFNLNWEGETSETYTPIIPATFTAVLHNDTNSRALMNDIAAGTGGQFVVCIYKYNSTSEYWDRMWTGPVSLDSITIPDASSNPPVEYVTLTATDGFGLLKDTNLTFNLNTLSRNAITYYICTALNAIPGDVVYRGYADAPGGTQTRMISTASVWYEDSMDSSVVTDPNHGDPLQNTLINESAFISVDDYGVATGQSLYDVLVNILIAFNLQISQWNGSYLIIQQNTYAQAKTRAWYYDYQNFSYIDTELINLSTDMSDRLTGGMFTHILPVKSVKTEYEYKNGIYGQNLLPHNVDEEVVFDCGLSTQNRQLIAEGKIETIFNDEAGSIVFVRVVYAVRITNGTKYLNYNETTSDFEWTTTATDYIPVRTTFFKAGYHPTQTRYTSFNWLLPALPEEGQAITFEWEFLKIEDINGNEYTATTPAIGSDDVEGTFNLHVDYDDAGEGTYQFKSTVNNSALVDIELEKSILGDGPNNYSAGALAVIDNTDTVVNSNVWTIYSEIGGTAVALNSLRCREMLALRRAVVQLYQGTFYGTHDFHKGFVWEGKNWAWLSMSYDCNSAQFSGTAMAVVVSRTSITVANPVQSQGESGASSGGGGSTIQTVNVNVNDGIFDLDFSNETLSVKPYDEQVAGGFDNSETFPVDDDRLNWDGYFYATKIFGATAAFGDADDYTEFEADGTLVMRGAAIVWDDVKVDGLQTKLKGTSDPVLTAIPGGAIYVFRDSMSDEVFFNVQLPHDYMENRNIYAHVHWMPMTSPVSSQNVVWQLSWQWRNINEIYSATASSALVVAATGTFGYKHLKTSIATITNTGGGGGISSILICTLKRLGGNASDTYTEGAGLLSIDFHVEKDTLGSRTQNAK